MSDPVETTSPPPSSAQPQLGGQRPDGEVPSGETVPNKRPRARERGRMRRRLRRQKQMREALLLDLGALVYELHRHSRREPELLQAKAAELTAVDQEVRGLAEALEVDESVLTLVAAGIAGSCESCGSLLSTDARYCGACGAAAAPAMSGGSTGPALGRPAEHDLEEHGPAAVPDQVLVHEPDLEPVHEPDLEPEHEPADFAAEEPPAPWLVESPTTGDGRSDG